MNNDIPQCESNDIHENIVDTIKKQMPKDEKLYDLAELFKVFGDSTRIRILWALDKSELCVCDISAVLNMSISAVSHQLRILKNAKLVKFKKVGKNVFYSLDDNHVKAIFEQGLIHIEEINNY